MSLKSRLLSGYCVSRGTPGILDPIRDKNGNVARLHVLGPRRTRKAIMRIQAEQAASREALRDGTSISKA